MNRTRLAFVSLFVSFAILTGCVSTTTIRSEPAGAEIIMDHTARLGQTPIELREMVWVWTNRRFEARMPGYDTQVFFLKKEYPWAQNLVVCLCTGLILWPVMLASKYTEQTTIQLIPSGGADSSEEIVEQPKLAFDTSP